MNDGAWCGERCACPRVGLNVVRLVLVAWFVILLEVREMEKRCLV